MKAYGNGTVRRSRPLVAALPRVDRLACWRADEAEHELGRHRG